MTIPGLNTPDILRHIPFSLVIPFLVYKLYKPGFAGASLIILGTLLNKLLSAERRQMPVYATPQN